MTRSEALARVMDKAAQRVLSGIERPYDVALETAGELVYLDSESESTSSWTAYLHWSEISDLVDAPGGPESEELCNSVAVEFSRTWLTLTDRREELKQRAFMTEFDHIFRERVSQYLATH